MNTVDLIVDSVSAFYKVLQADPNGRFRSWEHCYKCFFDARNQESNDYDYLSLQLAFYLASWGMYRGSSFLLQKDYKVHIPVVQEILKKQYDCLMGIECSELRKPQVQEQLHSLCSFMNSYYNKVRISVKAEDVKNDLSQTLITKILMGSLGCVPAYDRYFIAGVKDQHITTGFFNIRSLLKLVDFYENNREKLEQLRSEFEFHGLLYPQMKILDLGFWQIGFEKDLQKGIQTAH